MKELMNDLGVSTHEELYQFMLDHPEHPIVKQLNTFFKLVKENQTESGANE